MRHSLIAWLALAAATVAAEPVRRDHLTADLVMPRTTIAPGGSLPVALELVHDPKWHTYWINPGDSGLPTTLAWTLPPGVTAGDIEWPAPHRLPAGPLWNFGYDDVLRLPVELRADASLAPGTRLPISVRADWLVCEETCIPGDATFAFELVVDAAPTDADAAVADAIEAARAAKPVVVEGWTATFAANGDAIDVTLEPPDAVALELASLEIFAVPQQVLANARGTVSAQGDAFVVSTPKSDYFVAMPDSLPLVVATGEGAARRTYAVVASPSVATAAAGPVAGSIATAGASGATGAVGASGDDVGIAFALGLALLGGMLLNLMPCVFPVLALKAISIAEGAHDRSAARRDGLAYLGGVLVAFAALAIVLVALRGAGEALGWGFQLQVPWVVAALALLMVAVGLNLSGVFTIGNSVMGVGQSLTERGGARGAFFTGLLAAIVASPCTAPFMGPALGYAITQSAPVAISVFLALGFGLALPLVVVAFVPATARVLPRPGAWMDTLKQVLAFPMYATAVWLFWVLGKQAGSDGMAIALLATVALGFALWLYGRPAGHRVVRTLAIAAGLGFAAVAVARIEPQATGPAADATALYEPWTPQRLDALRREGRPVLVNMTAAWCITCLANEKVALTTDAFEEALTRNDVAYLKGDWTNRDAAITNYLAEFGRNGVPLYVLYPAGGGAPEVLPQMLTPGLVTDALDRAGNLSSQQRRGP